MVIYPHLAIDTVISIVYIVRKGFRPVVHTLQLSGKSFLFGYVLWEIWKLTFLATLFIFFNLNEKLFSVHSYTSESM